MRQLRGRWARWLPADKNASILDLGCGRGDLLSLLKSQGYQGLACVDLCGDYLLQARRWGVQDAHHGNALDYLRGKKDRFDCVCAFHLFEHLQKGEILQLLGLIHQALKEGGRLLVVTPNGLSPFSGATRYWDFSHETSFTPASWRQLARVCGFNSVRFEEYGPLPHSLPGIVRAGLWSLIRLALDLVSVAEIGGPRDPSRVYTADIKVILTKEKDRR